jgi:hypothetical protein
MNGFERYTKKTRREVFLEEMEQVVPWRELGALIEPHYPKPGNGLICLPLFAQGGLTLTPAEIDVRHQDTPN